MNASTSIDRKRFYQVRVAAAGLILGVACMVALFVAGIVTSTPEMVMGASTGFAAMVGAFTTAFVVIRSQGKAHLA